MGQTMSREKKIALWIAIVAAFFAVVALLRPVLTPFLLGVAVAYLLDPATDWLEARVKSRALATVLVLGVFFLAAIGGLALLYPVLRDQVALLAARTPDLVDAARGALQPLLERLDLDATASARAQLREAAQAYAGEIAAWAGRVLKDLWSGGLALFNLISLAVVTPLVAFYLLRDWDDMIAALDDLLPRRGRDTIREQVGLLDATVAGFLRGQGLVCLLLGVFYGAGLSLVGLDSGVLVGLMTGLLSFIPYLGMALGLAVGTALAVVQFDQLWDVGLVLAVFAAGQVLESFILTPRLVGGQVGLHPVWVLLALMAGGALFGFVGVLLAIPVAASLGVLVRFAVGRYRASALYEGGD
jgi:predicted PurR-regulated permease PerM